MRGILMMMVATAAAVTVGCDGNPQPTKPTNEWVWEWKGQEDPAGTIKVSVTNSEPPKNIGVREVVAVQKNFVAGGSLKISAGDVFSGLYFQLDVEGAKRLYVSHKLRDDPPGRKGLEEVKLEKGKWSQNFWLRPGETLEVVLEK